MNDDGKRTVSIEELAADEPNALCIGPFGSELLASDFVDDGVPVVFVRNVRPGRFESADARYIASAKAERLRAHRVRRGDIVITKMGLPPCVAATYPNDAADGIVTADIIKLTPDKRRVDSRYVVHFLNSPLAKAQVRRFTFGITRPKVTLKDFRRLRLPLPPLREQRHVADILDKADAIRRKCSEAIALAEKSLGSIFLEMFGDPVTNPKGWPTVPLGALADIRGGGTPSRAREDYFQGSIPWATAKDFRSDFMLDTQEHISEDAVSASATQMVPAGTILVVVKSKILMRRLPVAIACVPLCFNQDVKGLVTHIASEAAYIAAHLRMAQRRLLELARGVNTEGLTVAHLRNHMVMRPPDKLIKDFTAFESKLRSVIQKQGVALGTAENLLGGLVMRAFSEALISTEGSC